VCKESAYYSFKLCTAILMGCRRQLVVDGRLLVGVVGIQRPEEEMTYERLQKVFQRKGIFEDEVGVLAVKTGEAEFCDSVTGQPLDGNLA
jgi:hypothetical protein